MSGYRDSTEVKTADWASFYRAAQDSLIKEHTGIFSLAHGCVQKAVSSEIFPCNLKFLLVLIYLLVNLVNFSYIEALDLSCVKPVRMDYVCH